MITLHKPLRLSSYHDFLLFAIDLICLLLSVATYQPPVLGPSGGAGGNALRPSVAPTAVTPPSSVPLHQLHALIGQTNTT